VGHDKTAPKKLVPPTRACAAGIIGLIRRISQRDAATEASSVPSLSSFLARLQDPSEHQAIAAEHTRPSFTEVEAYYDSRPELSAYTLGAEVTRMDYEVLSGGGAAVTDPMKIQKLYATGAVHVPPPARLHV
tara:strand:- start:4465 stop:4860 length:396 start_codon:yes stop_codon:yes gene_type:complete